MKEKRTLLVFGVMLISSILFAQDFLGDSKTKIIKYMRHNLNPGYTIFFSDTIIRKDTIDHLGMAVDGKSKVRYDYFFDTNGQCDSIVMAYQCNECAESGIENVLGEKIRKWKMLDGGFYVSTVYWEKIKKEDGTYISSPLLQIKKTPGEQICTTIYLSVTPLMPKDRWKDFVGK